MIDLHCHALPGIDDGPADLGASVALARAAAERGMRTLVATPHIDHWWDVDPASLPERGATLQAALDAAGVAIEVRTGGEIALPRLPELTEQELDGLSLGGGRHVLLEAPLTPNAGDFEALVLETLERRPVLLAHPERCPAFLRSPERYERLLEAGVLGQVTAGSFTGQWGGTIRTTVGALARPGLGARRRLRRPRRLQAPARPARAAAARRGSRRAGMLADRGGAGRARSGAADPRAPCRGAQAQSLIAAITIPITTKTTTATCIHIQVGDTPRS